ncbi:MAG TPA: ABC transporter substrate-binding protein [Burkholderiales bacterium]|jgi:putative ABC transport system substrate-binding protein|nr:ABC transporter substrate-binding protein [Burkholderiales bacterium]
MNTRRKVLGLALAGVLPVFARAQTPEKLRRVGWLTGGSPKSHAKLLQAFREGLREHGWVEGRNLVLELRWAEGKLERVPMLAMELVRLKPDAIVTAANPVIAAVKKATSSVPIVMATGADPVAHGLVASLARPGGNVTGLSGFFEATPTKMLELAAALVGKGTSVSVLVDVNTPFSRAEYRDAAERTAGALGVRVKFVEVAGIEDVSRAFAALAGDPAAAVVVLPSPMFFFLSRDMPRSAAALKRPVIYPFEESAEAGGLMSYAAPLAESYRRAARYVDLILKGANPAELPIEQPTRLSLAVNLKTASAQGISIPREILLRADRTIE